MRESCPDAAARMHGGGRGCAAAPANARGGQMLREIDVPVE